MKDGCGARERERIRGRMGIGERERMSMVSDGELFQNMNTRVSSEPILLLIHQFERLSIQWMKKTPLNN